MHKPMLGLAGSLLLALHLEGCATEPKTEPKPSNQTTAREKKQTTAEQAHQSAKAIGDLREQCGRELAVYFREPSHVGLKKLVGKYPLDSTQQQLQHHMDRLNQHFQTQSPSAARTIREAAQRSVDEFMSKLRLLHRGAVAYDREKRRDSSNELRDWLKRNWKGIHRELADKKSEVGGVIRRGPEGEFSLEKIPDPSDERYEKLIKGFEEELDVGALDHLEKELIERLRREENPEIELAVSELRKRVADQKELITRSRGYGTIWPKIEKEAKRRAKSLAEMFREELIHAIYDASLAHPYLEHESVVSIFHHHPDGSDPSEMDLHISQYQPGMVISVAPHGMTFWRTHFGKADKVASFEHKQH